MKNAYYPWYKETIATAGYLGTLPVLLLLGRAVEVARVDGRELIISGTSVLLDRPWEPRFRWSEKASCVSLQAGSGQSLERSS